MSRMRVEDDGAPRGGVARLVIPGQAMPLIRRELEITDGNTGQFISATGWVPGRSVVRFERQEVRNGDLHIFLDGPLVNEVLSEFDPLNIHVPELDRSDSLHWPQVFADHGDTAVTPSTQILAVSGDAPPPLEPEPEREPQSEPPPVSEPPPPELPRGPRIIVDPPVPHEPSGCNKPLIAAGLAASLLLGALAGWFATDMQADRGETAEIADLRDQLFQEQAEVGRRQAMVNALRDLTTAPPDPALMETLRPQGDFADLDAYITGATADDPPGTRLLNHFVQAYTVRVGAEIASNINEPFNAEEIHILRTAVLLGNAQAALLLGRHVREHVPPSRDSVEFARRLFETAVVLAQIEGNAPVADAAQGYSDALFAEHAEMLMSGP